MQIGDVQVRNRGTVGGAIAHADPASDLPALGLALDYSVVLRSSRGERVVPLDGFLQGAFQTDIAARRDPDVASPRAAPGRGDAARTRRWPTRRRGTRSSASARSIGGVSGGSVIHARVAMTGVGEVPIARRPSESALIGSDGSADAVAAAAGARRRRPDRQQRHLRRSRLSIEDGGGVHPPRDRGRARPLAHRPSSVRAVRVERVIPGRRAPGRLAGAILTRDLTVGGKRWPKGRRLIGGRPARARRGGSWAAGQRC